MAARATQRPWCTWDDSLLWHCTETVRGADAARTVCTALRARSACKARTRRSAHAHAGQRPPVSRAGQPRTTKEFNQPPTVRVGFSGASSSSLYCHGVHSSASSAHTQQICLFIGHRSAHKQQVWIFIGCLVLFEAPFNQIGDADAAMATR